MACGFCPEASAKTRSAGAEIEKSPTLRAGVTPAAGICYGICSKASNSMKSANPHSGFYEADTARTIDTSGSDATRNQGGVVVVEHHPNGSRVRLRDDGIVQTLSSHMGTGGNNVPLLLKIRSGCEGGVKEH